MSQRLVMIRHGDDPPDDRIVAFAVKSGLTPDIRKPFKGEPLEAAVGEDVVGTVVHGGPFNAYDEDKHPFLHAENAWIETVMAAGKPVLGLCQGAQQMARLLGAEVGPLPGEPHEFGYYPVLPTEAARTEGFLDATLIATQAHFHGFETPPGAVTLATSALFPHQAFRAGANAYGLQFHPEVTIEGFRRWQDSLSFHYGHPSVQTREEQDALMHAHDAAQAAWFFGFLERLFTPHIATPSSA